MSLRNGLPWFALVLSSAAPAAGQATVRDEPLPTPPPARAGAQPNTIAAAARERRSISLSSDAIGNEVSSDAVPEFHTVERGDTLWDITGRYLTNPWRWPAVWGLNPQITNPHWIFPGDQVRLLRPGTGTAPVSRTVSSSRPLGIRPAARVGPQTVFLRDEGWLDPREAQTAGTVVGSSEDQMLLSEGDHAYVGFPQRTPRVGETFTVYREGQAARGGDRNSGRVVRILGTAQVESWNRDRRVATMRITESLEPIERGERVAAIPRRLEVVPPVRNARDLRGNIVAAVQPRELLGQNMVVFLNRGRQDGVARGNRFFVLRRGDAWRRSLTTSASAAVGTGLDRDGDGNVDDPPDTSGNERRFPEEIVGEILVVDVRERTATALVTSSIVEVEVGDVIEMRRGY